MTLLLVWRHENGVTQVQDFAAAEMTTLVREIAAALDIVDGGKMFREGIIADLERENMRLVAELKERDKLDAFVLSRLSEPLREAALA